jgi:hypothetical protein
MPILQKLCVILVCSISKKYVVLIIWNQSNAIIRPNLYFKNKIIHIYLENLNLFKMGVTHSIHVLIQIWNDASYFKFEWQFQQNLKPFGLKGLKT